MLPPGQRVLRTRSGPGESRVLANERNILQSLFNPMRQYPSFERITYAQESRERQKGLQWGHRRVEGERQAGPAYL